MATDNTAPNPALIERLGEITKTAQNLGRGEKSRYLQAKADELQMSISTLYRKLESVAVKPARKARSDKGEMTLTLDDAKLISSVVMEGMRKKWQTHYDGGASGNDASCGRYDTGVPHRRHSIVGGGDCAWAKSLSSAPRPTVRACPCGVYEKPTPQSSVAN